MSDSFYIGYAPQKPRRHRGPVRVFAAAAVVVFLVLAGAFAWNQHFSPSHFGFGVFEPFEGYIALEPVPHLVGDQARIPLVSPGKSGAQDHVSSFSGQFVRLRAQRIEREGTLMLEIDPASVEPAGHGSQSPAWQPMRSAELTITGEIVGAKCFLGVMNPGQGETHQACARHCILGGVPPMLRVAGARERAFYLTGLSTGRFVQLAGETVTLDGVLAAQEGLAVLEVSHVRDVP